MLYTEEQQVSIRLTSRHRIAEGRASAMIPDSPSALVGVGARSSPSETTANLSLAYVLLSLATAAWRNASSLPAASGWLAGRAELFPSSAIFSCQLPTSGARRMSEIRCRYSENRSSGDSSLALPLVEAATLSLFVNGTAKFRDCHVSLLESALIGKNPPAKKTDLSWGFTSGVWGFSEDLGAWVRRSRSRDAMALGFSSDPRTLGSE